MRPTRRRRAPSPRPAPSRCRRVVGREAPHLPTLPEDVHLADHLFVVGVRGLERGAQDPVRRGRTVDRECFRQGGVLCPSDKQCVEVDRMGTCLLGGEEPRGPPLRARPPRSTGRPRGHSPRPGRLGLRLPRSPGDTRARRRSECDRSTLDRVRRCRAPRGGLFCAATSKAAGSRIAWMRFTPYARVCAFSASSASDSSSAAMRTAASIPWPPAAATAAASAGSAAGYPIGACWIGREQPTKRVNSVSGRRAFVAGGSLAGSDASATLRFSDAGVSPSSGGSRPPQGRRRARARSTANLHTNFMSNRERRSDSAALERPVSQRVRRRPVQVPRGMEFRDERPPRPSATSAGWGLLPGRVIRLEALAL